MSGQVSVPADLKEQFEEMLGSLALGSKAPSSSSCGLAVHVTFVRYVICFCILSKQSLLINTFPLEE